MIKRLSQTIIPVLVSVFLLNACQPVPTPVVQDAAPCKGVDCLPPTLIPTAKPVLPTVTPTVFQGQDRTAAFGKEITFWHSYSLDTIPVITSLVDEFNAGNPDKIKVVQQAFLTDDQLRDALTTAIESDDLPDVVIGENGLVLALHSLGKTTNLIDFISDPRIGLDGEQQKSISSDDWEAVSYNGNVAGIPAQKEAYFLLYNSSWAKALGFDQPPVTLEEYSTQLSAAFEANLTLQDKNQRGTGGWVINWQSETALNFMGTDFNFDGMGKGFSQDIMLDTFSEIKEHQNAGLFWLARSSDPIPYFVERLALMVSASSRELPKMIIQMEKRQMQDDWSIIPYPRINTSAGSIHSLSSFGLSGDEFDRQLAGWLFIQWMMEPEHQAYISMNQYTIPSDQNAVDQLDKFASNTTVAESLTQLSIASGTVPGFPEWIYAKPVLSDGFKQLFQPETSLEMIPAIIDQMDVMYAEIQ